MNPDNWHFSRYFAESEESSTQEVIEGSNDTVVRFGPIMGWEVYAVERIVIRGSGTRADVHTDSITAYTIADMSHSPSNDVADQASPIFLMPGQTLLIRFIGAAGAVCLANLRGKCYRLPTPSRDKGKPPASLKIPSREVEITERDEVEA